MNTLICSVPVETPGAKLRRKRSEGSFPIMPKIACTALNNWAEKNGFKCNYYDIDMLYPSDEEIEKFLRDNPQDIIGLSAVVSTSYLQVKRLCRIIKKVNEKTLIVVGGYLTAASNVLLNKTKADLCVVGNGEIAWVGILKYMDKHLKEKRNQLDYDELSKIRGLAFLKNKKLAFTGYGETLKGCNLNFPDFDWLKSGLNGDKEALKNYFRPFQKVEEFIMDPKAWEKGRKPMVVNIFTSKGCVAKCTFCQRGSKGYDVYDLDKLDKYLVTLKEKYDVGFVMVADENFGSNRKYSREVAELFHKHGMLWNAIGVRCTSVDKEDLIHYQNNGCSSLKFGLESGSQTMLDVMEKKFTVEDIKKAIFACAEIGLHTPLMGFMVGMPGESEETIRESGELAGELYAKLKVPPNFIWGHNDIPYAIPLVGTPLYEYGKQMKLVGSSVEDEERYLEMTSNVAVLKRFFLNFNGAPITEVLFWDMLYWLECTRSYVKFMNGEEDDVNAIKKYNMQIDLQNQNPHHKAKQKSVQVMGAGTENKVSFNNYFVTNWLREKVIFNKTIAKLPRFIVNPLVKYSLYFEWLVQKYIFKDKHNLHKYSNSFASADFRLKKELLDKKTTSQRDRSLRTIVNNKIAKISQSQEAKVISSLTGGP